MLILSERSDEEVAVYTLPIKYLHFPSIVTEYFRKQNKRYLFQMLPLPADYMLGKLTGFGQKKYRDFKSKITFLNIDPFSEVECSSEIMQSLDYSSLTNLQRDYLRMSFQPKIFPEVNNISDLESELLTNLKISTTDKKALITSRHWGWNLETPQTLEEIGKKYFGKPVSRQRVEQIIFDTSQSLKKLAPYTTHLEECLEILSANSPMTLETANSILIERKLVKAPVDLQGILKAESILLRPSTQKFDSKSRILFAKGRSNWFPSLLIQIRKKVSSNGTCSLKELNGYLKLNNNEKRLLENHVDHSEDFFFLDNNKNWVFTEGSRNRVENNLLKIFSITDSLDPDMCREQVLKDHRISDRIPLNVFIKLSTQFGFVELRESKLERVLPISYPFEGAELSFLNTLSTSPNDYDIVKVEQFALTLKPPVTDPYQFLGRSPIIRRFGDKRWALLGDQWNVLRQGTHQPAVDDLSFLDAIDKCLKQMMKNSFNAIQQSGKPVSSIKKEKNTDMTREELIEYYRELIIAQNYRCNLTQIPFDFFMNDRNLMPSPDRVDSNLGYIRGNLQITCSFVNMWKSDGDNAEFLTLIAKVRSVAKL